MPKLRRPDAAVVRTTIELPPDLWRNAKIRAMNDQSNLRAVIIAALRAYLRPTKGERR